MYVYLKISSQHATGPLTPYGLRGHRIKEAAHTRSSCMTWWQGDAGRLIYRQSNTDYRSLDIGLGSLDRFRFCTMIKRPSLQSKTCRFRLIKLLIYAILVNSESIKAEIRVRFNPGRPIIYVRTADQSLSDKKGSLGSHDFCSRYPKCKPKVELKKLSRMNV